MLPKDVKDELNQLLYPLFVYIYLTLLQANKSREAQKFYSYYANLFLGIEGYCKKVKTLSQIKTYEGIEKDEYFKLFWEQNYIIRLTQKNLEKLKEFLKNIYSKVLLPLLHLHFFLEDQSESLDFHLDCLNEDDDPCQSGASSGTLKNESQSGASSGTLKNGKVVKKLKALKSNFQKISKVPFCPPPTYIHYIETCEQNLTSASINLKNFYLACGFEDSAIYFWNLSDDFSESETVDCDVSSIKGTHDAEENSSSSFHLHSSHTTNQKSKALKGHYGSVYALSHIPNYDFLLSCSEDTTVRLWNLKTCKSVAVYSGHLSVVWNIDVSSTCSFFASSSMDLTSRLWTFERDFPLRIFAGHQSDVDCVKFHPNERYIATGCADGTVLFWTVMDALPVRSLGGHMFGVSSISFSNNGKYLASGDNGGNIKIWDIASGLEMKEFCEHTSRISSLCFNFNDSILVSCSMDKTLKLWDVRRITNEKGGTWYKSQGTQDSISSASSMNMMTDNSTTSLLSHEVQGVPHFVQHTEDGLLTAVANCDT